MIKTTKTDFKQKQVFHDTMDVSGKATFGSDVEIDGKLKVNSASDIVDSNDKSIINEKWDLLMANMGVYRNASKTFFTVWNGLFSITDNLSEKYTDITGYLFNATTSSAYLNDTVYFPSFSNGVVADYAFANCNFTGTYMFKNGSLSGVRIFSDCKATSILVDENSSFSIISGYWSYLFYDCSNLTTIGSLDLSRSTSLIGAFDNCPKLKEIHCKHFRCSFSISNSTAFEEADLVEIISNLDEVTSTQTLTMGATNLAKLTDTEKKVATDKGWTLA